MTPAGNGEECITTVLIHGNPETDAIWTDLAGELTDRSVTDLVLLSPPGFGAPCRTDRWNTAYRRVDGVAEVGPNRNRVEQSAIGAAEPADSEGGQAVTGTIVEVLTK